MLNLKEDFDNMLLPAEMTEAYHSTLMEISRRREFIKQFFDK